jgi:tryptophan 2,3-dioxygenase
MSELSKPVLPGGAGSDYERYLRTDELLALQKSADERAHRDELLFQTVHQSSELWLKLAWNEIEEATARVNADDLHGANRLLRRANDCFKLVTAALDMLEHMSPWEYTEVRKVLGHGSGFERVVVWRVRHFKVVQRTIGGDVIGTQGTPVEVMGRLIHQSFYAELWDVRNDLTRMNPPE